jgi:hypothetical protein
MHASTSNEPCTNLGKFASSTDSFDLREIENSAYLASEYHRYKLAVLVALEPQNKVRTTRRRILVVGRALLILLNQCLNFLDMLR